MADETMKAEISTVLSADGSKILYPRTVKAAILDWDESGGGGGSGRRAYDIVIGTSTAGWKQADCDILCDGTNDAAKIKTAIANVPDCGSILFLRGVYLMKSIDTDEFGQDFVCETSKRIHIYGYGRPVLKGISDSTYTASFYSLYTNGPSDATADCLASFDINGMAFENISLSFSNLSCDIVGCKFVQSFLKIDSYIDIATPDNEVRSINIRGNTFTATQTIKNPAAISARIIEPAIGMISQNSIVFTMIYRSQSALSVNLLSTSNDDNCFRIAENHIIVLHTEDVSANAIQAYNGVISNNVVSGGSINGGGIACILGNRVYNASILQSCFYAGGSVIGNYIDNGVLGICGGISATGNCIKNPASQQCCICVSLYANNQDNKYQPMVSGNICDGAQYGIWLHQQSAFANRGSYASVVGNRITNASESSILIDAQWNNSLIANNTCMGTQIVDHGSNNTLVNNLVIQASFE